MRSKTASRSATSAGAPMWNDLRPFPILLTLTACTGPLIDLRPLNPVVLNSIDDAPLYPDADAFTFEAEIQPEFLGVRTRTGWPTGGIGRHPGIKSELWFVPLVPPGSPRRAEVRAWVSTLEVQSHGTPPDKWLAEVTAALAAGPVTWRVPPRSRARTAARRVNHWSAGITDAEERYGLLSHPDAPIFNWPP
jgi:hypothetical protein